MPVKYVIPISEMVGTDPRESHALKIMAEGAKKYLECFPWCRAIREQYFGDGYGGVVAVFLFRIEPTQPDVDEWVWVIFGDVPPAYLVTDRCKTPSEALEVYVAEVSQWVALAKKGRSSTDVIPVYVPANRENALELEGRLNILRTRVIPSFREGEQVRA